MAAHAVRSGDSHGGGSFRQPLRKRLTMFKRPSNPLRQIPQPETPINAPPGLGRAHRFRPRAGEELAFMAFGSLILSAGFPRAGLAVCGTGTDRAVGGAGR